MTIVLILLASYLVAGLCAYLYAVAKTYEIIGAWVFKIEENHIGICKYPKWLMGWMYWGKKRLGG